MKFVFISLALAMMAHARDLNPTFIPEASGVCRVGEMVIIAGDEEPKSFWLQEGNGKITKTSVKGAEWDDMEDLAGVSSTQFFAMTSHSLTKKGKRKPEREQLMLISRDGKKLEMKKSWSLREKILDVLNVSLRNVLDMNTVKFSPPDKGGLNVEGLSYHHGKLYMGLRSPVTANGEAIMLVIENGADLLRGGNPVISEVMRLNLSGQGIRGLASETQGLVILSGATDDSDETFGLRKFSIESRSLSRLPISGFEDLARPEGLFLESDGSVVLVQDFEEPTNQDIIVRLSPL